MTMKEQEQMQKQLGEEQGEQGQQRQEDKVQNKLQEVEDVSMRLVLLFLSSPDDKRISTSTVRILNHNHVETGVCNKHSAQPKRD
eukprot:764513-Hanusia_phi.AAC.3